LHCQIGKTKGKRRISSCDDYHPAEEDVVLEGTRKLLPFLSHPPSFWIYFINSLPLFDAGKHVHIVSQQRIDDGAYPTICKPVIPGNAF
jgi:hypothetical protein